MTKSVVLTVNKDTIQRHKIVLGLKNVQGEGRERGPPSEYSSHIESLEFKDDDEPAAVNN